MSNYPLLQEMPQNIESLDWHALNDLDQNAVLYQKLSRDKYKKHLMTVFASANIYQSGSKIFCLDSKMGAVTYYLHYQVANNGKLGDYVWQSLVWSYPPAAYIAGIPQQIFFENLLPKFGTIITDSQQTWDGKRFWQLRLAEAFEKKLNVYFYDFQTHEIIKIENYVDFRKLSQANDIWGPSDKHQMKRMVISNKNLPLNK